MLRILACAFVALLLPGCLLGDGNDGIQPGDHLPSLKDTDIDGHPFDSASIGARVLVLQLVDSAHLGNGEYREYRTLVNVSRQVDDVQFATFAHSQSDEGSVEHELRKVRQEEGGDWPLLVDQDSTLRQDLIPKDADGVLIFDQSGILGSHAFERSGASCLVRVINQIQSHETVYNC